MLSASLNEVYNRRTLHRGHFCNTQVHGAEARKAYNEAVDESSGTTISQAELDQASPSVNMAVSSLVPISRT